MSRRLIAPVIALAASVATAGALPAQGMDSVTVDQRVLLTPDLTPADARRRAIENALAEAVRRVAGVRVQSSAVRRIEERADGLRDAFTSVVQLDAAARAVDYRVLSESWERRQPSGEAEQLYLRVRLAAVVAREEGRSDPAFQVTLTLNAHRFGAGAGAPPSSADEIVATVRTTHAAFLTLFVLADDSASRVFPNEYIPDVPIAAGGSIELPDREWRARGVHLRATLPAGRVARREVLMVVATRASVPPPPVTTSQLELQRWLVRIPLDQRSLAFASYDITARP